MLGSLTLHIKMTQLDEEQCSFSNAGILNQSRRHALQESQGSLLKDMEATEITECVKGTEIEEGLAWRAGLSFLSPPPKEQEFVGNRCVSGSPVKSRLPRQETGRPRALGACHRPGFWRTWSCCYEHSLPKAQETRTPRKVLVGVLSGVFFLSLSLAGRKRLIHLGTEGPSLALILRRRCEAL